jgi:asparagine synthase (glutamine-hydrolysing)
LFLARDRMGQKPLYFTNGESAIAFASEMAPLRGLPWFDGHVSDESLVDYLGMGYCPGESTIYGRVHNLLPSTFLIGGKRQYQKQYFERNPVTRDLENGKSVRDRVMQSVGRQMVSDVPIGCFLSGGMDSSIIAASMVGSGGGASTFSVGFDDGRYDERSFAAAVARHLGTKHEELLVRPDAVADLPRLAEVFGEPFADSSSLPMHYLAKATRAHVKVALSGDGGDELFGGYDRYRAVALASRLQRTPARLRKWIGQAGAAISATHPKSTLARLKRFARSLTAQPGERYQIYMQLFDDTAIDQLRGKRWRDEQWADDHETLEMTYNSFLKDRDEVQAALATDRISYLPDDLLTKVDRCSMLHALEVRSPFMDHELVQFAAGLTTDQLLSGGPKRMLREAFAKDLPAWVFKRKKMGFAVPIGEWFRGELRPMLRETLFSSDAFGRTHFDMKVVERLVEEHEQERVDHSQRLYALLMLELWWNTVKK